MKTVTIKLFYGKGKEKDADVQTDGVPKTLIMDSLKTISSMFARDIVAEAEEMVPEAEMEKYIEARLKVDRAKEKDL